MKNDRSRIKAAAKAITAQASPRPWSITFMAWFLALDLCALCFLLYLAAGALSGRGKLSLPLLILAVLASAGVLLFLLLLAVGYQGYTLRLWRTGKGGPMDLFLGLFLSSQMLTMYRFLFTSALLWALPGLAGVWLVYFLAGLTKSAVVTVIFAVIAWLCLAAFLLNRLLPYALSFYVLLDCPDLSCEDAVKKSKRLMMGRRMDLLLLWGSFLGWFVLVCSVAVLTILPGFLILEAAPYLPALADLPSWFLLPFIGVALAVVIPLLLWLSPYMGVSLAGFYDAACAPPFLGAAQPGGKRLK